MCRCRDCPEAIGYDLCGPCYDSGAAGRGRFNQVRGFAPVRVGRIVLWRRTPGRAEGRHGPAPRQVAFAQVGVRLLSNKTGQQQVHPMRVKDVRYTSEPLLTLLYLSLVHPAGPPA